MVYLAIGVLTIALSVTVYSYRLSKSPQPLPSWKGKESPKLQPTGSHDDDTDAQVDRPTFTIDDGEGEKAPKSFAPAKIDTTAQRDDKNHKEASLAKNTTMMPPPPPTLTNARPKPDKPTPPLMPPPSRPTPNPSPFKIPPKPSTGLRPPPSTASTLRAPPSNSLKSSPTSLAPSTSTLAPTSRPSKKVLLDPGHSPLDWAHLTANPPTPTFLRGADVPPNLIRVPPSALSYHSGRKDKDAWGVYQGRVYNLTPYMKFHPGGVEQLMRGAGREREGERLFNEIHPWVSWENMLGECLVGVLVGEGEVVGGGEGEGWMDEMD